MSQRLINRSPDLKRLQKEGYDIEIQQGHLLMKDIPYLNASKEVKRGVLVSTLALANDITTRPDTHVISMVGEYPCNKDGSEIKEIRHQSGAKELFSGVTIHHSFSSKPPEGYADYYQKMTTYAAIVSGPARSLDSSLTAKTFPVIKGDEKESVFVYEDTASSRVEITALTEKLQEGKVALIGLGGTGSYILDLVAKTPIQEIHLFDGDIFEQHSAFRTPGAATGRELEEKAFKTDRLQKIYSNMRRGIFSHPYYIEPDNVEDLQGMGFAFVSVDCPVAKKIIIESLERFNIPFIDVGMGINLRDTALGGALRITTSAPKKRDHFRTRVTLADSKNENDEYDHNIQIADLNALNAALAVIKWKKMRGFYHDLGHEHDCVYSIDTNAMVNGDFS